MWWRKRSSNTQETSKQPIKEEPKTVFQTFLDFGTKEQHIQSQDDMDLDPIEREERRKFKARADELYRKMKQEKQEEDEIISLLDELWKTIKKTDNKVIQSILIRKLKNIANE